jgi:hypothetical protein
VRVSSATYIVTHPVGKDLVENSDNRGLVPPRGRSEALPEVARASGAVVDAIDVSERAFREGDTVLKRHRTLGGERRSHGSHKLVTVLVALVGRRDASRKRLAGQGVLVEVDDNHLVGRSDHVAALGGQTLLSVEAIPHHSQ